ncbi:hypothetical protein SDC9_141314 [bioreactor metagenome]|uniref:DUF1273 domain-containing protein n=1 Tax=bioreactor metagenome TaxID=1076179 RepID=A0A645DY22_9ZZZZ
MNEAEKRLHRCCFTGHRPEKLSNSEQYIKCELKKAIRQAIDDGFTVFITGMSRGIDLWAALLVLALRKEDRRIKLISASPYEGFEKRWPRGGQNLYASVLDQANYVQFIGNGYSSDVFQQRNEWMVAHSARVIAVYNGAPGGTRNTIECAKRLSTSWCPR